MFMRMFMVLVCLMSLNLFAQAQTTEEMVMVKKSDLPSNLVDKIDMETKLEKYGKFAGIGREIGMGVREGLSALTDEADKFSKTGVGKFTMYMVAFKILGNDAIQLFVGLIVGFFGIVVYIFYLINYCIPKKRKLQHGGELIDHDNYAYHMGGGIVGFLVYLGITMAIIFA